MPAKRKKTKKKKTTKRKAGKKKAKRVKLKKKLLYCPHCKKKVKVEDLEVIEDTKGMGSGVKAASPASFGL